ncbi:ParB/RepB/Spo0J family partition protein [Streptomyces sp. NPDC127037]|uniref:ParB/RepB/Spo0J family partition protein n=1 Tax=Streptomyces sp. NPDC127037 TaxID=3347113 RepID=UPI003668B5A8
MARITITHNREEGTLLDGSRKGDGVYEIVTKHGFRSSRNVGIYIRGSRDKEAQLWRINGAADALRAAGHEVKIEINEDDERSFAEIEAAREERAEERADRFSDRAGRAAAASDARYKAANDISRRFEGGQPILVGHHSERRARRDQQRMHDNMRKSIEEDKKARYWASQAGAADSYAQHRKDPYRTLRRLEKLRADLRGQERSHAEAVEKGWSSVDRHARSIRDLTKEIEYWEEIVEKARAEGVKIWRAEDFAPGDYVRYLNSWYQVARVNSKSLSIAWNLRLAPKAVMTLEDADFGGRLSTHTADYTQVQGRCPEAAMIAFLADGKVPGTESAKAASEAAPAFEIREAQAEAKKKAPKKRTDPNVARRVSIERPVGSLQATLTLLNGGSRPHKNFQPVKLTPPEGKKFGRAVWSPFLQAEVVRVLDELGYVCGTDDWVVSRDGSGYVRSIGPKPQAPAPTAEEPPVEAPRTGAEAEAGDVREVERTAELDAAYRSYVDEGIASTDERFIPLDFQEWAATAAGGASAAVPGETEALEAQTASDQRISSDSPELQGGSSVGHSGYPLSTVPSSERPDTVPTTKVTEPAPTKKTRERKVPASKAPTETPAAKKTPVKTTTPRKAATKKAPAEQAPASTEAATKKADSPKVKADTQRTIPIERIDRDPNQPRELFDEAKLMELANSMRELGQLQPISVRYDTGTKRYVLVMGERRWRAAKLAGLTEMKALVLHDAVAGSREVLAKQVAENVGRADMTPMEEAKSFKALEMAGYEIEEIGRMCGKSPAYIGWRIDLLKLCDSAQDALGKGHLGVNLAWYAAQLSPQNQMRFLSRYTQGGFNSDREAEAFVKACRAEEERREQQGSFFVLADETPAKKGDVQESIYGDHEDPQGERERIIAERQVLTKKIERLAGAGEILADLATMDPEELALLLAGSAGGVDAHSKRIAHLRKLTTQVIGNLTKAQAIASVRAGGIAVNPDAVTAPDAA